MAQLRIARTDELPPGKGKVVVVGKRQVIVYNADGRLHATANRHPRSHQSIAESGCAPPGQLFDVFAEDSPARLRADAQSCVVVVRDGAIFIELPEE